MPCNFRISVRGALGGLAALSCLAVAASARAEQFVLLDATFDYTWDDAMNAKPNKSHFYVNEGNFLNKQRPKDWTSPVDYRNGKLHVRTEVFVKPAGDQQVGWTLCYIANQGDYGCADTNYYESTGVFERETSMTDFWQNETIEWAQGIKQVDLIYAINDSGSGHVTNYPDLEDLVTPTSVRITMVQVSAGAEYDPSILELPAGNGGGGAGGAAGAGQGGMGGVPLLGGSGSGGGVAPMAGMGSGGLLELGGSSAGVAGASASVPATSGSSGSASTAPAAVAAASGNDEAGCSVTRAPRGSWAAAGLGLLGLLRVSASGRRAARRRAARLL
jgi:hypothetical protein